MGGNSSHESTTEAETTLTTGVNLRGLRNGDEVLVRGEAYAGPNKYLVINFFNGNDIVFHFKVLLLFTEGNFNKLKMNHRTNGKWGEEEYKDNLIYLNHHFELKFKCHQDKFSIEVNGKHWCDFKHRVSPDKINYIGFDGDAAWKQIDAPSQAHPYALNEKDQQKPTHDEVRKFVQSLAACQMYSAPGADSKEDVEKLSGLMTDGLEITKKLLGENKSNVIKNIMKYGGYLSKAFSAGSAVYSFYKFISEFGEPSDMERIMQQMVAINEQLKKLEATIQQGFADVIEHMDLVQFREEVKIPVRTMFDLYIRCFTVRGSAPIEDFKKQCKKRKSPRDIFSAMYEFLDSKKNIFETHLKTKKYVYSVYDEWSNALFNYATKLIIMNMFYYGILVEERKTSGNTDPLINEQDEIADLITQIIRMDDRLKQIEEDRMKTFHSGGYAKDFLKEHYKNVRQGRGEYLKQLPADILPRIAYKMKESWGKFNGPSDFQIMVIRGAARNDSSVVSVRYAACYIEDTEKVTVLENVGQVTERSDDTVSIALIQPITKEIREANEKACTVYKDKVKEVVNRAGSAEYILPAQTLAKINKFLYQIPLKPLLILYCTDFPYNERQLDMVVKPINYDMSSEAWSSPGGPCPLKHYWISNPFRPHGIIHRRDVQILFQ